jgi:hypothetical protein
MRYLQSSVRSSASPDSLLSRFGGWVSDQHRSVLVAFALLLAAALYGVGRGALPAGDFEVPAASRIAVKSTERHRDRSVDVGALRDRAATQPHFGS